ncbi:MAG: glycosyltransferase family 2 protein [Phototrophicaceae bacterium]
MISGLLSVVIPNWNGKQFLHDCLTSLRQQTYPHIEVIIADNASHDGSREFTESTFSEVIWVQLPHNQGFTGACNAGMTRAQGEYICLLNNDTAVDAHWAQAVVDAFAHDPQVGSVASKMLLFDRRDTIHTTGDQFTQDGRAINRGVWQKDEGQFDELAYVFSACGGSSTYRRTMLDQIGLLDDDFFFLLEDVDLGWRAQLAGWRCLYTPHAIVYHHLSATGGGVTASFHDGRNSIYLLVKDVPRSVWQAHGGKIIRKQVSIALEALRAWRGKAARARLRGMVHGMIELPKLLQKRRSIQATIQVNAETIDQMLIPPQ